MYCLLGTLKLCVEILRCYHFFNIFWVYWSMCLRLLWTTSERYVFSCTWKIRQIRGVC